MAQLGDSFHSSEISWQPDKPVRELRRPTIAIFLGFAIRYMVDGCSMRRVPASVQPKFAWTSVGKHAFHPCQSSCADWSS